MLCRLLSYEGGFLVGSGEDVLEIIISPETNLETVLSFFSDDFETDPPSSSTLTCLPQIEIDDITFQNNALLDLLVAPFLPNTIEPLLEPTVCEPLEDVESMLSEVVLNVSDVLDYISDPIPPELTDKLLPEKNIFGDGSTSVHVDFLSLEPIVDLLTGPIEGMVSFISSFLGDEDGILSIPINMAIDDSLGIDLNEIRIIGLNNFTSNPLSLLGNFTLTTSYNIPYMGFEVELGVRNEENSTDTVLVKAGVEDVEFDFALLLVIEQSIMDVFQFVDPIFEIISNFNVTDLLPIVSEVTDLIMDLNTTDLFEDIDISNITDIAGILEQINVTQIIEFVAENIDFTVFDGVLQVVFELIGAIQEIDIIGIFNHMINSIFAVEIASFSLTAGSFDAPEVSGLTQFIGPQKMFNEIADALTYMYEGSLINTVDFFLQSITRGFLNDLIRDSFVYDSCLDEFMGTTVYVPSDDACYKVELFFGGEIAADYSDPTCSQGIYLGEHMSYFGYSSNDTAHFTGDWFGEVVFVEDFSVPELVLSNIMDNQAKLFSMTLTYPSCTQSFDSGSTSAPSTSPSENPIICKDSSVRFKTSWNGRKVVRDCTWIGNRAIKRRCALEGVSGMCAETCRACSTCADSTNRMKVVWNGRKISRDCIWVKNRATRLRCALDGVADACRATCGQC